MMGFLRNFSVVALMLAGTAMPAMAYIGPGAGLGAIGTLIALIGAVLLAIVGFVWYPVKRLMKRRKAETGPAEDQDKDAS